MRRSVIVGLSAAGAVLITDLLLAQFLPENLRAGATGTVVRLGVIGLTAGVVSNIIS